MTDDIYASSIGFAIRVVCAFVCEKILSAKGRKGRSNGLVLGLFGGVIGVVFVLFVKKLEDDSRIDGMKFEKEPSVVRARKICFYVGVILALLMIGGLWISVPFGIALCFVGILYGIAGAGYDIWLTRFHDPVSSYFRAVGILEGGRVSYFKTRRDIPKAIALLRTASEMGHPLAKEALQKLQVAGVEVPGSVTRVCGAAIDPKSGESLTEAERDALIVAGQTVATCKHVLMPEDEFCPECGAKVRK